MLSTGQVLGNMKHCILATDLALFFPNKVLPEEKSGFIFINHSGPSEQPREGEDFQLGRPPAQVESRSQVGTGTGPPAQVESSSQVQV